MEKTISQIQEEAEVVKVEVKKVLKKFMDENPSICLSGEFGVEKTFITQDFQEPEFVGAEVSLILNISIDEK